MQRALTSMAGEPAYLRASGPATGPCDQLAAILETIPDAALLIGRDRRILAANQRYRAEFADGCEVRGRPCFEVAHDSESPCGGNGEICPLDCCAVTGARVRALHVHAGAQGLLSTDVVMRPLADESGLVDAFLAIVRPLAGFRQRFASEQLAGTSAAFDRLLGEVERLAADDRPVLIVGEPGTGKEQLARVLHELGARRSGPFVPVDCGPLHDPAIARERGDDLMDGLIAAAAGGTLFLKEIEALETGAQASLLAALDESSGSWLADEPTGSVRWFCSSNLRPEELARTHPSPVGLLARIAGRILYVPALRERADDVPILARALVTRLSRGCRRPDIAPESLEILRDYPFPGNLRELASILERACVLASDGPVLPRHLPPAVRRRSADVRGRRSARLSPLRST